MSEEQHSCLPCDYLRIELNDFLLASCFLLHFVHISDRLLSEQRSIITITFKITWMLSKAVISPVYAAQKISVWK